MLSSKTVCKEIKLQHHGKDIFFDKLSSYRNPKDNSITFLKKFSDNSYNEILKKKEIFLILPSNLSKNLNLINMHTAFQMIQNTLFLK